jgi:hypothetical protein
LPPCISFPQITRGGAALRSRMRAVAKIRKDKNIEYIMLIMIVKEGERNGKQEFNDVFERIKRTTQR